MTAPAWISAPTYTVTRDGRHVADMTVDEITLALVRTGLDAITTARVETALELGMVDTANEWLTACDSGLHVTRKPD